MVCPLCGQQNSDEMIFCTNCGQYLKNVPTQSAPPESEEPEQEAPIAGNDPVSLHPEPNAEVVQNKPLGMKWHYFLVYFSLWFGMLSFLVNGSSYLLGTVYTQSNLKADDVYRLIPGLRILDPAYGILLISLAVIVVITTIRLIKFKAGAPKLLIIVFAVNIGAAFLYDLLAIAVSRGLLTFANVFDTSFFSNLVVSLVMLGINYRYYKKRAHLFVC